MLQPGKHPNTLRVSWILWVQIPMIIVVPMITYTIAITNGEVEPFPNPSVTETACFYPQNILFRFTMMTSSSFFSLIFFCVFKWLIYEADRIQIPLERPTFLYWPCQFMVLPYLITIATIDGAGVGPLHAPCAITFFMGFWVLTVFLTYVIYRLKEWDSSVISQSSWRWKLFTCCYLTFVWVGCISMFIYKNFIKKEYSDPGDWLIVLEWNSVFVNILWLLSFSEEFKRTYVCVVGKKNGRKQQVQIMAEWMSFHACIK